ncbi:MULTISPECIES: flagellar protein FliS [unclassified Butyrivibrio]|uniref:flagellar protein FliS n=1 Tax=unclassified Butyrivibrio TaxID=2639466 RepID=UPI0003B5612D|nr:MULTISPECIES: flagellar protein FliS [unclassified Butyrivibrio]MDC7292171.1 flagellar protein FliS [Butyrivibrio sp. DSM 10294]
MTSEKKQEFTLRISNANKTQMITILYEILMCYADEAIDLLGAGKKDDAVAALDKAQNCLDELIRSVDRRFELGKNLHRIYLFSKKELTVAAATGSMNKIWRVEKNIRALHEAYKELETYDNSAPMMENIQTVYAGLTYGRSALNESIAAVSMNRGYVC